MRYISRAEIIDAIERCNTSVETDDETGTPVLAMSQVDGTYRLVPTWIGNTRVWMAERIVESSGYEVAYQEIDTENDLYIHEDHMRFGAWVDGDRFYLDRTMHIRGTRAGQALDVARLYNQKAIWSWHDEEVIETSDPATGL